MNVAENKHKITYTVSENEVYCPKKKDKNMPVKKSIEMMKDSRS